MLKRQASVQKHELRKLKNEIWGYKQELKNLDNTNSKLIYDSFIKQMRDLSNPKDEGRLNRYKSQK